ncbi:hypothetical protein MMC24_001046 [Lignoscripta atroalba]|nr:hypothetical protein [Lignoscripta atroalba]
MFYTNQLVQLPLIIAILSLLVLSNAQIPDSLGYILPTSGFASTTQFMVGPELGPGTACGAVGWANGVKAGSPPAGGGPGFLYAAINQLGFGANPLGANAGGPGAACGICYKLTPVSASGEALTQQAMTFMIIDECPVSPIPINNNNCGMCKTGDKNIFNQEWHFDIAVDAMNQSQYDLFFKGVTYGS